VWASAIKQQRGLDHSCPLRCRAGFVVDLEHVGQANLTRYRLTGSTHSVAPVLRRDRCWCQKRTPEIEGLEILLYDNFRFFLAIESYLSLQ
jgi:hypothetical protein